MDRDVRTGGTLSYRTRRYEYGVVTQDYSSTTGGNQVESVVRGNAPRVKPHGFLFPTPYYRLERRTTTTRGYILRDDNPGRLPFSGVRTDHACLGTSDDWRIGTTVPGVRLVDVDLLSQAEVKALNDLQQGDRDGLWNAGQAWGERKETVQLLHDTVDRLTMFATRLKRGDWRRAQDLLPVGSRKKWADLRKTPYGQWLSKNQKQAAKKAPAMAASVLANGILEYQNGWKPLLKDVYDATEALAWRDKAEDWLMRGSGKHFIKKVESELIPTGPNGPYVRTCIVRRDYELEYGARVVIYAYPTDPFFRTLASSGITNPGALVWELLPLSYMVDYFISIGDWLNSLSAPSGFTFHSGSSTTFCRFTALKSSATPHLGQFSGSHRTMEMERVVLNSFPVPIAPLSLKPGKLKNRQLANMLAVFHNLLTGQGGYLVQ